MLAELARQTLETNHRPHHSRTQRCHQAVQCTLASPVAGLPHPAKYFQRSQIGLLLQDLFDPFLKILDLTGSANSPPFPFHRIINLNHRSYRRRSASPNIGTLPPTAPLRSSYDQPSTRSQLHVVLAFPTSSSLRPAGLTDPGAQEEFYPFRPSPDGSEFPGMKGVKIFGTDGPTPLVARFV